PLGGAEDERDAGAPLALGVDREDALDVRMRERAERLEDRSHARLGERLVERDDADLGAARGLAAAEGEAVRRLAELFQHLEALPAEERARLGEREGAKLVPERREERSSNHRRALDEPHGLARTVE